MEFVFSPCGGEVGCCGGDVAHVAFCGEFGDLWHEEVVEFDAFFFEEAFVGLLDFFGGVGGEVSEKGNLRWWVFEVADGGVPEPALVGVDVEAKFL